MEMKSKVCVTGAAGYIGSWLVNKLLQEGCTVHATLRNLDDTAKTGLLKSLPNADTRLELFKADIYDADEFDLAIDGCEFVFHVATPLHHNTHSSKYKDTTEAAVAGVKSILGSCTRSRTVKRLIYTGSITAASPLKEDNTGFKDFIDESCWTPLNLLSSHFSDSELAYVSSKTESEKVVLSCCNNEKDGLEVVSLACGVVGGDTLLPHLPWSTHLLVSEFTGNVVSNLRWLERLLGSVPLVHIDDVCEAHVFCMKAPSMSGRFLCACAYPTTAEIENYYREKYTKLFVAKGYDIVVW
ncbi:NADPH HC-toxin reductase 1-like isoform X2 [Tasmannia lanceolata]|uniref:NADPH HC-toxin reductase 1-like isoform X2 n=1 Tax=Tasmannia lanceolata TaxID=3420 RepID=UPI0040645A29